MTCIEFQKILHDLDRPGTQGLAKRESALAHAESCNSCGGLLTEAEALDFGLHTLALQGDTAQAPVRVEAALMSEFRRRHSPPARRYASWYAVVAGIAALALLAVGLMRSRVAPIPNRPSSGANPAVENIVANAPAGASSSANSANQGLNEFASTEEGSAFVRLPYADDAATLEGGAVIRVALPRSALASWGLPVAGLGSAERIPAELVVSADGMPQAVRLISEEAE